MKNRCGTLSYNGSSSFLNPVARVADRVQGDVPHPTLVPEARHAEPAGAHALVALVEGAQALRAQVLLGLHLDGVHTRASLHEEVDLAAGVLGRPVKGREAAVRNELLADVLFGEGPLNSVKMPPPSTIADGLTPLIAPQKPYVQHEHLEGVLVPVGFSGMPGLPTRGTLTMRPACSSHRMVDPFDQLGVTPVSRRAKDFGEAQRE